MKSAARAIVGVVTMSLLATVAFGQGMTWDSNIVSNGHEMVTHTYYVPKKLKTVNDQNGDFHIIRIDQDKVYTVHTKEKTYSVMTFAEIEQMGKQMNAQMEQLQKQMKDMPEEQRKMMEKMLGGNMPGAQKEPKIEVTKTGEQKSINGFACNRYIILRDGKEEISLWVTPDVKGFAGMKQDLMEQTRRMSGVTPSGFKGLVEAMQKVDGFPIETEMGTMMKTTVTKVDMKTVASSEFEVPAGFTKVENKILEGKQKEK
jgi:GLPGLI family protein